MEHKDHQLSAILFSDIVGYSAIMSHDEDEAWKVLQKAKGLHIKLIKKYRGKLLKELGDGFLICFHSVIDAVHCAKELIHVVTEEPFQLRIGIHLGDVIESEGDVYGEGVNIAARLQQEANENEVLISESVYLNIRNQADLETNFIGEKELKNIREPINLYKLQDGKIHSLRRIPNINAVISIAAVGVLIIFVFIFSKFTHSQQIKEPTIAILPFVNLSDDPEQEYFSDGVSDEIRAKLGYIQGLIVRGRSSSVYFKNRTDRINEIAEVLNVNYILEGSTRAFNDQVHFNLSLVDTRNNKVVLPIQVQSRDLQSIYDVQAGIAKMVAEQLEAKLLPEERRKVEKKSTESFEAYQNYLLGRFHFLQEGSRENIDLSIGFLDKAIELDSNFAEAYAMKVEVLLSMGGWGYQRMDSAAYVARPLAERALLLDPQLSESHMAMASIYAFLFDLPAALKEIRKGIELDPQNDWSYARLYMILSFIKEHEEAINAAKKAKSLNPTSPINDGFVGQAYFRAGKLDSAILELEQSLERFPDSDFAKWELGGSYLCLGNYEKAIELYLDRSARTNNVNFALGYAYALNGNIDSARMVLSYLVNRSKTTYVPPSQIGLVFFGLGNEDSTYYWMEKAHRELDWSIVRIPFFDSLLSRPPYNQWFGLTEMQGQVFNL